jgi:hypothetical protein
MGKLGDRARASERVASDYASLAPANGRLFLVASDPYVFLYPRGILADTDPGAVRCSSILSAAHASHRITRLDDRTLALEPIERSLLEGSFDTLFRGEGRPFSVGDTFRQCGAEIRVTNVDEGRPARIEVTFDRSLDDDALVVLVWREHHLDRLERIAIGDAVDVAWSAGPAGL